MTQKTVIIIGAGPAGMAAAFELNKVGKSFTVVEKDKTVGGLAKTLQYGEFRTDIGPHRFISNDQYLCNFIKCLLEERWLRIERLTRFYISGKFFLYPIKLESILSNVKLFVIFRIFIDYLFEKIRGGFEKKNFRSFEDYIIFNFGRALAELNMLNYTEKIWGLPCSEISLDWAKQRIKGLSLKELIGKIFIKSNKKTKTLIDRFHYPDIGIGLIYEKIKERILKNKIGIFRLNSYPVKLIHDYNKLTEVIVNVEGNDQIIKPEYVISSIPVTEFVNLMKPKAPNNVLQAAKNLRFRSHVSLFITLNKPSVFPDQWIYFPDKEVAFGRIMEPKNFSKKMSPEDRTSLLVEFFCWEKDKIWNATKEDLFELSIKWLEKLAFIKRNEVIDSFVHREKHAYPLYDLNYKEHLRKVKDYLRQFKNLQLIGRGGSFRYNNQDHALEMGILAARTLIEKKQLNVEEVGIEQEYFEKDCVV